MESNSEANDSIIYKRKQAILSSLCKHLSLDPQSFSTESAGANDIESLFANVLKLSGTEAPLGNNEVMNWVAFADSFPVYPDACDEVLNRLNEDLSQKSVLLGDGLKISVADIVVFSVLHSFMSGLSVAGRLKYPNVLRWMDYIQNKEDFGEVFEKILVEKIGFEPQVPTTIGKVDPDLSSKKSVQKPKTDDKLQGDSNSKKSDKLEADTKSEKSDKLEADTKSEKTDKLEADSNSKKGASKKKVGGDSKVTEEKKKVPEKESVEKDTEVSVSLLNIQVGLIHKAWKHPSADSLLVEEIDIGDGNIRQVVSGLAKYCSPDELTNRRVALITNVKPGRLRDVSSSGLVLCASNQDHTVVEPLLPPEGAKLGERVSFSGHDGKPEDVLNPKKKQLDKITPHLYTDDKGVATFKGIPFMTTAGPCTSSVHDASIK